MPGKHVRFLQTIQMKLIIIYVLLILIAMQLIGVYFIRTLEASFLNNFSYTLNQKGYLLAGYVRSYLEDAQGAGAEKEKKIYDDLNIVVRNLLEIGEAEVQVMDSSGKVVGASVADPESIIGQKNTQTEVTRALQGIRGNERTFIDSDKKRKRIIAMPVRSEGKVIGAIYIVASMEEMFDTINRIKQILLSGTLIALGLTALLGVVLSNTIVTPIKEMTKKATAIAEGRIYQKVNVHSGDEIGQLGFAFNYMSERLKEALSANEEEKEKLASILSNMSDGVVATDDQGKVIVMNLRAREMLQVQGNDWLGKDIADLLGLPKESVGQHVLGSENIAVTRLELSEEEQPLVVRITFNAIHRRGRGITGTIAVLQDITEQEKLEQARREFVANVSHELRTPLTTIKSYLEALDDGAMDDPELAKRFLGVTKGEAERMIRLVSDLLHLSRLDSRRAVMAKQPIDLAEVLEEVSDRFSFQLQQRSIELVLDVARGLPKALVDRDQIDQVLDNLMSNAIKYTGDQGRILLGARPLEKSWVEISVQDNGIGIPKKDLSRIFERFYRVDKARSRNMGGTGLGLSIAREIVKAHGGAIGIESEVNQGTKVTFTLPIHEPDREQKGGGAA
ncbi:cell wall metabolism sensor histidine kinase WalK [Paenibacillus turpanensis]|uniref:cell wall metabolism sensor histidine kinase WalK n=1 Tax=Paenibacillus turpanensis TaxID=2689078 RepID=UPI00140BFD43|nr:cell wall metabolism sensor histidine kinase WalK [Paenibacillus turpanensis]